jgi:AcrR family transcriptional regulator
LIERDGLAAFSIRGLGAALGCEPMSIYHYYASKAELLDALVDRAMASVVTLSPETDPFDRIRQLAYSYRSMAHRNPKLFQLVAVHRLNAPVGVRGIEGALELVRAAVPDDRLAAQFFRVLGYYLTGAALDETAGYAKGPSAAQPASGEFEATHFPRLDAVAPYFREAWRDATFALGLDALLAAMHTAATALRAPEAGAARAGKPIVHPKH